MPSARVGIIPQSVFQHEQSPQQQRSGDRPGHQQGITMEDLKKRTALRLAREQQQRRCFPSLQPQRKEQPTGVALPVREEQKNRSHNCRTGPVSQDGTENWRQSSIVAKIERRSSDDYTTIMAQGGFSPQPHHNHPVKNYITKGGAADDQSQQRGFDKLSLPAAAFEHGLPSPCTKNESATNAHVYHVALKKQNVSRRAFSPQRRVGQFGGSDTAEVAKSPTQFHHQPQQQRNGKRYSATGPGLATASNLYTHSSNNVEISGVHKQIGGRHNKLPHGLTVHELKEMTKARLQAEAAEKNDREKKNVLMMFSPREHVSTNQNAPSGVGRHSCALQDQELCREFAQAQIQHRQNPLDPSIPAPSTVVFRQKTLGIDTRNLSQSSQGIGDHSPISQVLTSQRACFQGKVHSDQASLSFSHSCGLDGVSPHHQNHRSLNQLNGNWHHQQMDAWETASVTSMNSTIGSESVYSSGKSGMPHSRGPSVDDIVNIPFARSRSYPAGSGLGGSVDRQPYENTPTSTITSASSIFDFPAGTGQNRRRACTLSPPGLLHLHEDRPLTTEGALGDDLAIPTFDAPTRNQLPVRVNATEIMNSPSASRGSSPSGSRLNPGGVVGGRYCDFFNRPRSSSATSLPSVSTAEEFHEDQKGCLVPLSNDLAHVRPSPAADDLPSSVAESVLGATSSAEARNQSCDLAAVFRGTSCASGADRWTTLNSVGSGVSLVYDSVSGAVDEVGKSWGRPSVTRDVVGFHPRIQKSALNTDENVEVGDDFGSILIDSDGEGAPTSSASWIDSEVRARHNPTAALSLLPSSTTELASPLMCSMPHPGAGIVGSDSNISDTRHHTARTPDSCSLGQSDSPALSS